MNNRIGWFTVYAVFFVGGFILFTGIFQDDISTKSDVSYTSEVFAFTEGETEFTIQYSPESDFAELTIDGTTYELEQIVSASGAKYTNTDESVVFWEHQGEALVEMNGKRIAAATIQTNEGSTNGSPTTNELTGTTWQWQETQYNNGNVVVPNQAGDFVLTFMDEDRFSASTDCNNLMGDYGVNASSISFTQIAGTKMACPDIDSKETAFAKMLEETNGFIITEDGKLALIIKYDSGSFIFSPVPTPTIEATPSDQTTHSAIIGTTVAEAEAYAKERGVSFRTGSIDGEGMLVTMDFQPGRITAAVVNNIVVSYTVE